MLFTHTSKDSGGGRVKTVQCSVPLLLPFVFEPKEHETCVGMALAV